jgi:flagellin
MISLQTNVNSLEAIQNLNTVNAGQGKTIQQLSSGFRINSSGDDAAGLAVANGYQNQVTQLTQGVNNANNGIAQLQVVDGGLSNISNILNRLQTLATESATGTFTGSRATLNQEYQNLMGEITRQASDSNLNFGGSFNKSLNVFIGGSSSLSTGTVNVDLSGSASAVDATSLGLAGAFTNTATAAYAAPAAADTLTFKDGTGNTIGTLSLATGTTETQALSAINAASAAGGWGISAADNGGKIQFRSASNFAVSESSTAVSPSTTTTSPYYTTTGAAYTAPTAADTLTFKDGSGNTIGTVTLAATATEAQAIAAINNTTGLGITAADNGSGKIVFNSLNNFSVTDGTGGVVFTGTSANAATAPTSPSTAVDTQANAQAAITAIATAIQNLGLVQGRVGAGENQLQYAVGLAQSQITNFSSAEGQIKDADIATQASNLTKGQVLEQTAVAALAQANSMPQAVLKLLQ